jgi:flagellin-like hook-associated protein FlgL
VTLGAGNPTAGDSVTVTVTLPDGSTETLRLVATTSGAPGAGEFSIGANTAVTAANLETALETGLVALAGTKLTAASAMVAADNFFSLDAAQTPQRVAGPPFVTATGLVAATPANTVFWYTGEVSADPARSSVSARIDQTLTLNYGLRANEPGIRALVQNLAVFAATTFPSGDDVAAGGYAALVERVRPALEGDASSQKIEEIVAEIGAAQGMMQASHDRQQQTNGVLTGLLEEVEGVSSEEVAAKILTLQTRLQASLQTTAILYQLSLADYI